MQGQVFPQRRFFDRVKKALASIGAALATGFKLLGSLKILAFLKTGGTMFISIFFYAQVWGWRFAVGFVLLLFVHETGHLIAARMMGLKVGWPVFIPFMGALIALKEAPRNAWVEAVVGIGGPVGSLGSLAVWVIYFFTGNPLFLAVAYSGFFLNLFNLIPIVPFDGGRIVAAISPWFWLLGLPLLAGVIYWTGVNIIFLIIVVMLLANSLPRVIALFRKRTDVEQRYFECTPAQRWTISLSYFTLLACLAPMMYYTHHLLSAGSL